MNVLLLSTLAVVALTGTATVLVRDPARQLVVAGIFGLALAIMFFAFGAPDVALSQIVVSAIAVPVMALLTLVRFNRDGRSLARRARFAGRNRPEGDSPDGDDE